ncbi:MAG: hypothetical protein IJO92_04710 [Clostridia bacterium]|nr:hypothetical protein [Clostridia bacterium]
MKEIGGYFGFEQYGGEEYHCGAIGVNSGRNALLYLLRARRYRKLYIPRFLCDSVYKLCVREGIAYEEYPIDASFRPVFERELQPDEAIYVVNFYGQISNQEAQEMKERWGNLIFDNVQAFFQQAVPGIDTIYSCRKFFGVPDGGYVSTEQRLDEPLERDQSKERMEHILGRLEETAAEHYAAFQQNDELFYDLPLRKMSVLTENILRGIDYAAVRRRREENYAVLEAALGETNPLKLCAPIGPYCYPFYCKNGMELKKMLAREKIYVATLWPNVLEYDATLEKELAENILPLPCDQRYGEEDMDRIVGIILNNKR